jgi:hypothetical protein
VILRYFVVILILIGFVGIIFPFPSVIASEPQIINENRIRGDAHPDSCTRWQQWDYGFCVDKTNFPAHIDAINFMKIITVPFIGAAAIFVVTTTTPRVSKKKRIAMIVPCIILIVLSPFVIFMGGLGVF